ncbi:MAG: hypothetical protein R6U02_06760 [Alkalibacterium sp.]|uniref:hypothetical protein n=1 Tax=Alkalibacterium sp. TaxID=1872447 RepID=UPI003970DD56
MKKRFIYVIDTPTESKELLIREDELIENADGELDCPLDLILQRYHMEWDDLIKMKASTVSLMQEDLHERRMIRSISFENLYYFHE